MSEWQPIATNDDVAVPTATNETIEGRLQVLARDILSERARRPRFFPEASFGEVAWDILLSLYVSPVPVLLNTLSDQLGKSVDVTARWITFLEKEGIATKSVGKAGVIYARIELTEKGRASLKLYLSETLRRQNQRYREYATRTGAVVLVSSPRAVAVLGTAIFSTVLTWGFMSGHRTTGLMVAGTALCIGALWSVCSWVLDNVPDVR